MITNKPTKQEGWIEDVLKKERVVQMIIKQRKKAGLSSWAVAEKAGIAQSTWSRTESGARQTTWDVLLRMAEAVGLDVSISIRRKG